MPPIAFTKPKSWEEFFFPLLDIENREKAVEAIWRKYELPSGPKAVFFRFDSSLPKALLFTTRSQAIIQLIGPGKTKICLSDEDILITTGNLIFMMVIVTLFETEGDIELCFHSPKWSRLVFGDFDSRNFTEAHGDYSSLKCYIFLLCEGRRVNVYVDEKIRLDTLNSHPIVLTENFERVTFKHNFVNSKGILSISSKLMFTIYQGGTYKDYIKSSRGEILSGMPIEYSSNTQFISGDAVLEEREITLNEGKGAENAPVKRRFSRPEGRDMKRRHSLAQEEEIERELEPIEAPNSIERPRTTLESRSRLSHKPEGTLEQTSEEEVESEMTMLEIRGTKEQLVNLISYLPLELISTLVLK